MTDYECKFTGMEALRRLSNGIPVRCMYWNSTEYLYRQDGRYMASPDLAQFLEADESIALICYLLEWPWETALDAHITDTAK